MTLVSDWLLLQSRHPENHCGQPESCQEGIGEEEKLPFLFLFRQQDIHLRRHTEEEKSLEWEKEGWQGAAWGCAPYGGYLSFAPRQRFVLNWLPKDVVTVCQRNTEALSVMTSCSLFRKIH